MPYTVQIDKLASTSENFPVIQIVDANGYSLATLDVQATAFGLRRLPTRVASDFLLIAATVYSLDKLVLRSEASNAWTRVFSVTLPVSDASLWTNSSVELNACVSFLTGDEWTFSFTDVKRQLFASSAITRVAPKIADPGAVSLFSGGMDSLAGVIDWLEEHPNQGLLLVGHHDGQMAGPYGDQKNILPELHKAYPNRLASRLVRVGNTGESAEITLRGRSLLFIAIAVCVASGHGFEGPLVLPENGTIALNVPLSPSRRGSCSTRTAHPFYVSLLKQVLAKVGLNYPIENPLMMKTKGEVASTCANNELFKQLVPSSVSCAKRGHTVTWKNRHAKGCGMCMPCIYRRAALHSAGLDNEIYGRDICTGEVDFNDATKRGPADLRACISFLQRNPTHREIGTLLLTNGHLPVERLSEYSDLVVRAFEEIRQMLRDKGTTELKRMAGIIN
jgi:7-cyano-7-deazaguanine synthase in queuosine biosynthesis